MSCFEELSNFVAQVAEKSPLGISVKNESVEALEDVCKAIDSLFADNEFTDDDIKITEDGVLDIAVFFSSFYIETSGERFIRICDTAKRIELSHLEDDSVGVKVVFTDLFEYAK